MKTTYTIAAIAMFAVILGMGALSPAMAAPNNDKSSAKTAVCHYFAEYQVDEFGEYILDENDEKILIEEESFWGVLYVSSRGAANGHSNHGDLTMDTIEQKDACVVNQDGTIEPIVIPDPPVA